MPTPATLLSASMTKPTAAEDRYKLLRSVGEECITDGDLRNLVEKKPAIRCYDGFEPSGRMHIAQGIYKAINVNKCTASGCEFVFWVADWFALMNDKMGGELEKIRIVGKYLVEVWRSAGMNMENVKFLWSSEEINRNHAEYWRTVLDIARRNTIARIKKCCTIMGKQEGNLTAAQVMYPLMQCADIFYLKADICQLGQDQRKVNMLAREYCDQIGRKLKPVVLSHHMLAGLKAGQAKMSKSDPESAIFMEDTAEDVERKIMKAHCPRVTQAEREVTEDGLVVGNDDTNPCLDYLKCVVFSVEGAVFEAGGKSFGTYEAAEKAFVDGELSEEDLKRGLISVINALLDPVRKHFTEDPEARALLETIKAYKKGEVVVHGAKIAEETKPKIAVWVPAVTKIPLSVVLGVTKAINGFLSVNPGGEAVLVCPDLSATTRNELTGDEKDVSAALAFNVAIMRQYGLNPTVTVVRQSELCASKPSDYWLSVIAAGRKYHINRVEEATGEIHCAGLVAGALMRMADAEHIGATTLLSIPEYDAHQNELYKDFSDGKCDVVVMEDTIPKLCDPKTAATGPDDYLFADDTDMDIRRKMKRAFAAERDAANPVVDIAAALVQQEPLIITRKPENGGDITVSDAEALRHQYGEGQIHPGDLKAAVAERLLALSQGARKAATEPELKKLSAALRQVEKKLSKRK